MDTMTDVEPPSRTWRFRFWVTTTAIAVVATTAFAIERLTDDESLERGIKEYVCTQNPSHAVCG